ncbi:FAD-dependent oxidoreductase [Alkalihalobacillus sp. MEB130]|uniref:NAD(P)/FAD-dependent oxidoreductase n=1 Tax=Alkalihalobacillus sp. MEB130 TaxID=2976704 RepID=UPI0028E0162F|nr:FAD-dependent oxidoreductase [Alkalihalobacillus sp. MEB130]MDT8861345.1 FAD-dependent oxidoreductase [Alkalihalobacillus sp. MEB130]
MKRLLLVGAGYGHLYFLKKLRKNPIHEVEITLISPDTYYYSKNMLTGYAEGLFEVEDIRIEIEQLVGSDNVTFIQDAVLSFDPLQKSLLTTNGRVLSYDAVSFDLDFKSMGSYYDYQTESKTIQPNTLVELIEQVKKSNKPVVAGCGLHSFELALALQESRKQKGFITPVTFLVHSGSTEDVITFPLTKLEKSLQATGIDYIQSNRIECVKSGLIDTGEGAKIEFDHFLWLAGRQPYDLFVKSLIPTNEDGHLLVNEFLQSTEFPSVFGVGECVSVEGYEAAPKNSRYIRKQAHVLFENLVHFFKRGSGVSFSPTLKDISVASIGNKKGIIYYREMFLTGKIPWFVKTMFDRNDLNKLKN